MAQSVSSIAVIGAGQMGAGIAQVAATAGLSVFPSDTNVALVEAALASIGKRLDRSVEKGTIATDGRDAILARIAPAENLGALAEVDVIIEAIVENSAIKVKLFQELDGICKPETLFASNTSSIPITQLAAATKRSKQFIGMHFMNPVSVMQLVEVIRGLQTSDETYQTILDLTATLGKTAVTAHRDFPGFVVNRILTPMLNEACFVVMEGIATPSEIDTAMKLGTNQPMGPLELADFVGLDTCLAICRILHNELGEDKYRPCPLLVKYVEAGWYGRKSGRGFYQY